jgi:hypothetical protein
MMIEGQILKQPGNGEVKHKKFGATAAGTVYRRISKRRV